MPKEFTKKTFTLGESTEIVEIQRHEDAIDTTDTKLANHVDNHPGSILQQNIQTVAAYTLVLADASKVVEMDNAAANTVTVPTNATVAFPVGTLIEVFQMGAGSTSIAAATGVVVHNAGALRAQYSSASLRKRAIDEWVASGDIV